MLAARPAAFGNDVAMKRRHIRIDDRLEDDDTVVVRGGELGADEIRADALRSYVVYGTYAISVFALRDVTFHELAQESPLVRFDRATLMKVGAIRAVGLRLEATGRDPRHYSIEFDDLDEGVDLLRRCEHNIVVNPYNLK